MNCSRANDPTLLNLNIGDTAPATDEKILNAEHRVTWYKYCLEQAVDLYGAAKIVANTDHQYLTEKHKDYVGYANDTTRPMIKQLEMYPTILNEEKLEIRAAFFSLWSDAPDMNLGEYSRTLDKHQYAAKKLRVKISDEDKKQLTSWAVRRTPKYYRTSGHRSGRPCSTGTGPWSATSG